jgi:hypothetical protein
VTDEQRWLAGLDQQAPGPVPRGGRGGVRAAVPRPSVEPGRDPASERRAGLAAAQGAHRGGSGCWCRHDRLAPGPPPRHDTVPRDHQPDPGPGRRGHPGTREAPEEQLPAVRGRAAQRVLAVRLHPLPARRRHPPRHPPRRHPTHRGRHRRRDPDLARRLLPLRPVGDRAPAGYRPGSTHDLPQHRRHPWLSGIHVDRQRPRLHRPTLRRHPRPQPPRVLLAGRPAPGADDAGRLPLEPGQSLHPALRTRG